MSEAGDRPLTTASDAAGHSASDNAVDKAAFSALLDGELSEFELRRLLQKSADKPQVLAVWERYNLVRSALQGEPFRQAGAHFSSRVAAAIAQQPPLSPARPRRQLLSGWMALAGKLAVAASVTAAAFLGMQYTLFDNQGAAPAGVAGSAGPQESSSLQLAQGDIDAEAQQRLNEYIQSVTIPLRSEPAMLESGGSVLDSALVRPVSDRELIRSDERR